MSDQLEKEFKVLLNSVGKEIEDKVKKAEKLMQEAEELADRYGLPFQADMYSDMRGWYVPESYSERFGSLDKETVAELIEVSAFRLGRSIGWQHSNIC